MIIPPRKKITHIMDAHPIKVCPLNARMKTQMIPITPIREMTIQPQNIDHMIAAMYREMDL